MLQHWEVPQYIGSSSRFYGDAGVQRAADMADELLQQKESRAQAGATTSTEQWVLDMEVCWALVTDEHLTLELIQCWIHVGSSVLGSRSPWSHAQSSVLSGVPKIMVCCQRRVRHDQPQTSVQVDTAPKGLLVCSCAKLVSFSHA